MSNKLALIFLVSLFAGCSAEAPIIGECYVESDRDPFTQISYACVQDVQGNHVLAMEREFNEASKKWECKKHSVTKRYFGWTYDTPTAYRESELCPNQIAEHP